MKLLGRRSLSTLGRLGVDVVYVTFILGAGLAVAAVGAVSLAGIERRLSEVVGRPS